MKILAYIFSGLLLSALFFTLSMSNGLLDNNVLQMMQLPDNRMAIMTVKGLNIYENDQVRRLPADRSAASPIPAYRGFTHLYADNVGRLWVKDVGKVSCADLNKMKWIKQPLKRYGKVDDIFVDSNRQIWLVRGDSMVSESGKTRLKLPTALGDLQDMDSSPLPRLCLL